MWKVLTRKMQAKNFSKLSLTTTLNILRAVIERIDGIDNPIRVLILKRRITRDLLSPISNLRKRNKSWTKPS